MIIINSAAYVNSEFQTEFGEIPPSMLPIGNKKLIEHQYDSLAKSFPNETIFLSLPLSFEGVEPEIDEYLPGNLKVLYIADYFTLAEAILYILNVETVDIGPIRLLHGDTLLNEYPKNEDVITVSESTDEYTWEHEEVSKEKDLVWNGFFSFSCSRLLMKSLALSKGRFVEAVKHYKSTKALSVFEVCDWYDLGHINTYFKSRSKITTQRCFNSLRVSSGVVLKKGDSSLKISSEAQWFDKLPTRLKRYTPQLIDFGIDRSGSAFYEIEYLPMSPLNEVYVHGVNTARYWKRIYGLLEQYMAECRECETNTSEETLLNQADLLYRNKSKRRFLEYLSSSQYEGNTEIKYKGRVMPRLSSIVDNCIEKAMSLPIVPAVLHGDLCFSNILFDSRSSGLKVIDPRGVDEEGSAMLFGDQKYDLAKLSHSVLGMYDFIISGRYKINQSNEEGVELVFFDRNRLFETQEKFLSMSFIPGVSVLDCMPLTILLFFSMLPLHRDNASRQEAMLLNAVRLYAEHNLKEGIA